MERKLPSDLRTAEVDANSACLSSNSALFALARLLAKVAAADWLAREQLQSVRHPTPPGPVTLPNGHVRMAPVYGSGGRMEQGQPTEPADQIQNPLPRPADDRPRNHRSGRHSKG